MHGWCRELKAVRSLPVLVLSDPLFCCQMGGVDVTCTLFIWYFWVIFSALQWAFMMFAVYDVFASYPSALHTSLARIQGFLLMVTMHNSTALKTNNMTEDNLFVILFGQKRLLYPVTRHIKAHIYAHNFSAFFPVFEDSPLPPSWWMSGNRH